MANDVTITPAERLGAFIQEAALNPNFDADKFVQVVQVHLQLQDRQDKGDFNEAFAKVQGELEPIVRMAENKGIGNKYAGLDAIDAVLRPICKKHGLSTRFSTLEGAPEGHVRKAITVSLGRYSETNWLDISTTVRGSQGGRIQANEQQQAGIVSTYARRYLLNEFFNIATIANKIDDTDGEPHGGRGGTDQPPGNDRTTDKPPPSDTRTRFKTALAKLPTRTAVQQFMAIPGTAKWRDSVVPAARAEIDAAVAKRIAELPAETPTVVSERDPWDPPVDSTPPPPAGGPEWTVPQGRTPEPETTPPPSPTDASLSPVAQKLLADIGALGPTALNGISADPDMRMRMAALDYETEGRIVEARIKELMAAAGGPR